MSEVVLVRPGCTDFDEQHRIQGTLDLPLNKKGQQELGEIASQLKKHSIDVIFSAPCESARLTAKSISGQLGIPVKELEELRNLNQGLWQGLQIEEVKRKFPKVYKQWIEAPESICPPEGEMVEDALERIRKVLRKPIKKKKSFAIVAPDPLATLVGCVIRGASPELKFVFRNDSETPCLVELLEKDGKPVHQESTNKKTNGDATCDKVACESKMKAKESSGVTN